MKKILVGIFCSILFATNAIGQDKTQTKQTPKGKDDYQIVEASCGQCNFNLPGNGCNLAIRIKDKAYFVDGTKIDDHGDAHASDGFCSAIRKAKVKGKIVDNRFQSEYFKLIPQDKAKKETK